MSEHGSTVEATGETVGEAKWKALRELERLTPRSTRRPSASRCCPRESAVCSASATRRPASWRASRRRGGRRRRGARRRERDRGPRPGVLGQSRPRSGSAAPSTSRGRRRPDRDLLRRRARTPDRQARRHHRRRAAAGRRDRGPADGTSGRTSSWMRPAIATGAGDTRGARGAERGGGPAGGMRVELEPMSAAERRLCTSGSRTTRA